MKRVLALPRSVLSASIHKAPEADLSASDAMTNRPEMTVSHPPEALFLASTSEARRKLVSSLGLPFQFEAPGVDEDVPRGTPVSEAVLLLARRKAEAVFRRHPGALVVGSDQLVELDGRALGKPPDAHAAREQLQALSGRAHHIVTGVCVFAPGFERAWVETTRMELFELSDEELDGYVATGEWRGCAGAYRVEGRGQALFRTIEGDRTNVQGLPMTSVVRALREAGVPFFQMSF